MSILREYLDLHSNTETPTIFHRWGFIAATAAALSRNVWIKHGSKMIYPSMYIVLIGHPGARKAGAFKPSKYLRQSGYYKFAPDKTSPSQFITDLLDGMGTDKLSAADMMLTPNQGFADASDCFISQEELVVWLGTNNREFATLLTKLWDNPPEFKDSFRKTKACIVNPTVNIFGAATPAGFHGCLPPDANGIGLISRMILVYGEPSNMRITWPSDPDQEQSERFVKFFSGLQDFRGELVFKRDGAELIDKIYKAWENIDDGRLVYYGSRRLEHLFRLCIVIAAINGTKIIDKDIVLEANSILVHTERHMSSALGEFGKSTTATAAQGIMTFLENVNRPVKMEELYKVISQDCGRYTDFLQIVAGLQRAEKIQTKNDNVLLVRKPIGERDKFTDYAKYVPEAITP